MNRKVNKMIQYNDLPEQEQYIDKTACLEKGMATFPSLYIEGNAVVGKSVAVNMFLAKRKEQVYVVIDMKDNNWETSTLQQQLGTIQMQMSKHAVWVIFENINEPLSLEIADEIADFCEQLIGNNRAILIGRERIHERFLPLLWKHKMELITQQELLFTKEEISRLGEKRGCKLNPVVLYEETGGWAGCVDLMIRLSMSKTVGNKKLPKVQELRKSYEIDTYIHKEILGKLSKDEQRLVFWGQRCPWIATQMCLDVWNEDEYPDYLERLARKGIFQYDSIKQQWRIAPLFQRKGNGNFLLYKEEIQQEQEIWRQLGQWYYNNGNIREALFCFKQCDDKSQYQMCMIEYYNKIPFLGIDFGEVLQWKDDSLELCYLRGMHYYFHQDFYGLQREISLLEQKQEHTWKCIEILCNLNFVKPDVSLEEWLQQLEHWGVKIHLYSVLGYGYTFLCGMRDLSGLFACSKKEEHAKCRIWKQYLGDLEWKCYQMARIDYYLETDRKNRLEEEDENLLQEEVNIEEHWQLRLGRFYLLCKMQKERAQLEVKIEQLKQGLLLEEQTVCVQNTESIGTLYGLYVGKQEQLVQWLRESGTESKVDVNEKNFVMRCYQAKGYVLLSQFDRAERILKQLIPYARAYHRYYFLAELLFQQGIVRGKEESHSQALKCMIETFLVTGNRHYVGFYTEYGKNGLEVIQDYIEWLRKAEPEKWTRKKRYNYANVVRMPMEEYMEVIIRYAEKNKGNFVKTEEEEIRERLTLMEISVLQSISKGKRNGEIGEELHLKLTTVKTHVYNLYKKLGVSSRVQAVKKGKEIGLIE